MARKPNTIIYITHPDLEGIEPSKQTLGSFEKVWAKRGWVEVNPEVAPPSTPVAAAVAAPPAQPDQQGAPSTGITGAKKSKEQ